MTADLLAVLRTETARLGAIPAEHLDSAVPAVPGWTVQHVIRHTGKVHRWATAIIEAGAGADTTALASTVDPLPKGPDCLDAYRDSAAILLEAFRTTDLATTAESFLGPANVGWWLRRQAHETTVHRFDAADAVHAAGGPAPADADAESAADGVGEITELFRARVPGDRIDPSLHGKTMHVHGTDTANLEWVLTFGPDGVDAERSHTKADVALRGSAQDLLLVLHRRRPVSVLDSFGDVAIAQAFLDVARL